MGCPCDLAGSLCPGTVSCDLGPSENFKEAADVDMLRCDVSSVPDFM